MIDAPGTSEVWVAAGTYKPTSGSDRTKSFEMKNGVTIYGGFPATGNPTMNDRDWTTHVSILSGDIGVVGDRSDNSYHVFWNTFLSSAAILDGFTIRDGYADDSLPHDDRVGGGMVNLNSTGVILNCIFTSNEALIGGGMYNFQSSMTITNCVFAGNAASNGGGMVNYTASPTISNCTFFGYSGVGGAMWNTINAAPIITNSILWGNYFSLRNTSGGSATVTYSIVEQFSGVYPGAGNLNTDPLFVNEPPIALGAVGDLRLTGCSPAVDAGINGGVPPNVVIDLDDNARIYNAVTVDMGAYEFQSSGGGFTCYADPDGDGYGDPASTTTACSTCPTGYVLDNTDNCPFIYNPDQDDSNQDGEGDICEACPDSLIIYPYAPEQTTFQADIQLSTTGSVVLSDSVTCIYKAGESITLNPGFEMDPGTELEVNIENCSP